MSKLSPFKKHSSSYMQQYSPLNPYCNENRMVDKQKRRPNPIEHTNKRYYNDSEQPPKLTEKKRYDQISNIDIDHLLDKNKALANQNTELYLMLEERGKIIVALEKKLEEQVATEMMTLQAIEYEKSKFIAESHKKFKDYERKIEELINEIYLLNEEKEQGNYINAKEMHLLKETLNQEQLLHFQSVAQNQASARQLSQLEIMRIKNLLEGKNHEIAQLNLEYLASTDKLKNEVIALSNEIVHLNHLRKMELSEQKIMFEGMLDNLSKDHHKEKEILIMGFNAEGKKLMNVIAGLQSELSQLGEVTKIGEIQQNTRELQLIENKNKLENQMHQVEQFHRKSVFEETQKLKQLNKNEVMALEVSNDAITNNLKAENAKLISIINAKSQEIDRLLGEMNNLRAQQSLDTAKSERLIHQLKEKMRQMEASYLQEEQTFKTKYAQLREADILALKQFYEHQIDVLSQDLQEKSTLANKNRALLHEQLHSKNEMRKTFDVEILKLNLRIGQLELFISQRQTQKKVQLHSLSDKMQMTSSILLRETKDKQKVTQINQEEKKNLQELILTKDKEIEELNSKIVLLNKHNLIELSHKNEEIALLKKMKDDIEVELRKEKYFYDSQIKKKEGLLKSNAENYRNDIDSLKKHHREEIENSIRDSTSRINDLEVELSKYHAIEKTLKNQVTHLNLSKEEEAKSKSNELSTEKERMFGERKESLEKLQRYYQGQLLKLTTEIGELKRQLTMKEQDLRSGADKYHRLQQKLQQVIQSQQRLRQMQSRIVALGQDNNLVKNFVQIIKSHSR